MRWAITLRTSVDAETATDAIERVFAAINPQSDLEFVVDYEACDDAVPDPVAEDIVSGWTSPGWRPPEA